MERPNRRNLKFEIIKLNIGCGETKLKGFINIDAEKKTKPDLLLNITKSTLPFKDGSVTQINCIHNIEHISQKFWPIIFKEFHRVLKDNGVLYLAYPEFERCAKNFIENHRGMRDFWRATLYGRQSYPGDYHVVPMVSEEVAQYLIKSGFKEVKFKPEVGEEYNTFLMAVKGELPLSRVDVVRKEVFERRTYNGR